MLGSYTRGFTVTKLLFVGGAGWGGVGEGVTKSPPTAKLAQKTIWIGQKLCLYRKR